MDIIIWYHDTIVQIHLPEPDRGRLFIVKQYP